MQTNAKSARKSAQCGNSPMVFSEIFSPETSIAYWQRPNNSIIQSYFLNVAKSLSLGHRSVYSATSLSSELQGVLPDGLGKKQAISDIQLLVDMLTCLFDCEHVGLRLTAVDKAMCPRLHVDNIPVRLITTYCGAGTQWLPNEFAELAALNKPKAVNSENGNKDVSAENYIQQLDSFDVALLKGSAFDSAHAAAIHRSCPVTENQWRVLLTLDPT